MTAPTPGSSEICDPKCRCPSGPYANQSFSCADPCKDQGTDCTFNCIEGCICQDDRGSYARWVGTIIQPTSFLPYSTPWIGLPEGSTIAVVTGPTTGCLYFCPEPDSNVYIPYNSNASVTRGTGACFGSGGSIAIRTQDQENNLDTGIPLIRGLNCAEPAGAQIAVQGVFEFTDDPNS